MLVHRVGVSHASAACTDCISPSDGDPTATKDVPATDEAQLGWVHWAMVGHLLGWILVCLPCSRRLLGLVLLLILL